jgi:hypothetical protein
VLAAVRTDPLQAALEALFHAVVTCGSGYPQLLADVRSAFPALRTS